MYPQSHWSMQLTVALSDSQCLLSNSVLFCFKFKNEFILQIYKVKYLSWKKNVCPVESEIIVYNSSFLTQRVVFNPRLWMENHWWNVKVFIIKQITKPFLEEIFLPADSKSLRLKIKAFEMQLSQGVWG